MTEKVPLEPKKPQHGVLECSPLKNVAPMNLIKDHVTLVPNSTLLLSDKVMTPSQMLNEAKGQTLNEVVPMVNAEITLSEGVVIGFNTSPSLEKYLKPQNGTEKVDNLKKLSHEMEGDVSKIQEQQSESLEDGKIVS